MSSSRQKRKIQAVHRFIDEAIEQPPPKRQRKHSPVKTQVARGAKKNVKQKKTAPPSSGGKKSSPRGKKSTQREKNEKTPKAVKKRATKKPKTEKQPKQTPKKWQIKVHPSIKVIHQDPFFSAKNGNIPFVSTNNYSKLSITAVLTKNKALLKQILADTQRVSEPHIGRSVFQPETALMCAIRMEDHEAIRLLIADTKATPKRAPQTVRELEQPSTGSYNWRSLGIRRIRKINIARGSREGNAALTKDERTSRHFLNHLLVNMLEWGVTYETVTLVCTLIQERGYEERLSSKLQIAARWGNYKVAAKIAEFTLERNAEFAGIGRLHWKVLECSSPSQLPGFRAASVTKKSRINDLVAPLHLACINPHAGILSRLLTAFPEYTLADKRGWRPVHYAAACQGSGPLELLLKRGVNPYEITSDGLTPLHVAAQVGRITNVNILIMHATNADKKTSTSKTPLKKQVTLKRAVTMPARPDKQRLAKVNTIIQSGDVAMDNDDSAENLDEEEADLSGQSKFGLAGINRPARNTQFTPLHLAASRGHLAVVEALLDCEDVCVDQGASASRNKMTALMMASEKGYMDVVRSLVEKGHASVEYKDKLRRTPLMVSVLNGHTHVASYLLHRGANPCHADSSGNTVLHYAASYGWYFCADLLLKAGADASAPSDWKVTPLSAAFLCGNLGIVKLLLTQPGADVNFKDDSGVTLLMMACRSKLQTGLVTQVRMLVEDLGADCTACDIDGRTALHFLACNGLPEDFNKTPALSTCAADIARILMRHGLDPDLPAENGIKAIDLAARTVNLPLVELLTERKCCLSDQVDFDTGTTLLHDLAQFCAEYDLIALLSVLMKEPLNVTALRKQAGIVSSEGCPPLLTALRHYLQRIRSLVRTGADTIVETTQRGVAFLRLLVGRLGGDVNAKVTPTQKQDADASDDEDADSDTEDEEKEKKEPSRFYKLRHFRGQLTEVSTGVGVSALLLAALSEDHEEMMLRMLIEMGGSKLDLNPTFMGRTALLEVVQQNRYKPTQLLIEAGANVQLASENTKEWEMGQTPLMAAVWNANKSIVKCLLDAKADVSKTDQCLENTALHYACCYLNRSVETESIVGLLLSSGKADLVNKPNKQGRTPLHLAANFNKFLTGDVSAETEEQLLDAGADPRLKDSMGCAAVHYIFANIITKFTPELPAELDPMELTQVLAPVSQLDATDCTGRTPLHWAALRGATVAATFLVQKGAKMDARSEEGNTPLTLAVRHKHLNCAMAMVQLGASVLVDVVLEAPPASKPQEWTYAPLRNQTVARGPTKVSLFQSVLQNAWQGLAYILSEKLLQSGLSHRDLIESCIRGGMYSLAVTFLRRWAPTNKRTLPDLATTNQRGETLVRVLADVGDPLSQLETQFRLVDLLTGPWDVSATRLDSRCCHPLVMCALRGHYPLAKHLIEKGLCKADDKDGFGRTCLIATFWNSPALSDSLKEWLLFLIPKYAQANQLGDLPLLDPLVYRLRSRPPVDYFKRPSQSGGTNRPVFISPLIGCIRAGDLPFARFLLTQCQATPHFPDNRGCTPLMHAVQVNQPRLARLLTDTNYDGSHDYDKRKKTSADRQQSFHLLDTGSPNEVDEDQESMEDEEEMDHDADTDVVDSDAGSGDTEEVEDTTRVSSEKINPVDPDIPETYMQTVVTSGLDLNQQDSPDKWTALHHLASPLARGSFDNAELLRMLVDAGADLDKATVRGETVLTLAIRSKAPRIAKTIQYLKKIPKTKWVLPKTQPSECLPPPTPLGDVEKDSRSSLDRFEAELREPDNVVRPYESKPDQESGMHATGEIMCDNEGRSLDVMLSKIDVKRDTWGLYNFYQLQVIHQRGRDLYFLFTRWGRIGSRSQHQCTPFPSLEEARAEFEKVFRAKSGNRWADIDSFSEKAGKYRLVSTDKRASMAKKQSIPIDLKSDRICKLDKPMADLMKTLIDVKYLKGEMTQSGLHQNRLPFGRLKPQSLNKAKDLLKEIKVLSTSIRTQCEDVKNADVNKIRADCDKLSELSNSYFWLVPQESFAYDQIRPLIDEDDVLQQENLLNMLTQVHWAGRVMLAAMACAAQHHPLDYVHASLGCRVVPAHPDDWDAQILLRALAVEGKELVVTGIYRIHRPGATTQSGHLRLLWHGTSSVNLLSILHDGLLVSPPTSRRSGQAYGSGIYLTDTLALATGYCRESRQKDKFLLLNQVDLHGLVVRKDVEEDEKKMKKRTGVSLVPGRKYPDPLGDFVIEDGCVISLGPLLSRNGHFQSTYNQYVIADQTRITLRYLVKFRIEED